ncbi:MAG: class I lanthipeptide [Candidatus Aminicenantes bacterium]|nr:class I lanthipeptide [Candidatus Aminicenantes bacterium]
MKMKKIGKKLLLNKEIIASLDEQELNSIKGGQLTGIGYTVIWGVTCGLTCLPNLTCFGICNSNDSCIANCLL